VVGAHHRHLAVIWALLLAGGLALCGCGAPRAAANAGKMFDKYGCLSRDFKGEQPCADEASPPVE